LKANKPRHKALAGRLQAKVLLKEARLLIWKDKGWTRVQNLTGLSKGGEKEPDLERPAAKATAEEAGKAENPVRAAALTMGTGQVPAKGQAAGWEPVMVQDLEMAGESAVVPVQAADTVWVVEKAVGPDRAAGPGPVMPKGPEMARVMGPVDPRAAAVKVRAAAGRVPTTKVMWPEQVPAEPEQGPNAEGKQKPRDQVRLVRPVVPRGRGKARKAVAAVMRKGLTPLMITIWGTRTRPWAERTRIPPGLVV